jgi:RNase P/RNase MRP subunit p29
MSHISLKRKGNTKVINNENELLVTLYHTDIVHATNELITLNTGGYETVTTKNRMNQAASEYGLGYYVYKARHQWYVNHKGNVIPFEGRQVVINRNGINEVKVVKAEGELNLV